MNHIKALRVHVEGRVQGVGYRYWVVEQASALRLDGWVRNHRDGRVEVVVSGSQAALDEFLRRCHKGPALARVVRLAADVEADPVEPGFRALPTV